MADQTVEVTGSHRLTFCGAHIELFQNLAGDRTYVRRTCQNNDIAVGVRVNSQPVFNECEVAVHGQRRQALRR